MHNYAPPTLTIFEDDLSVFRDASSLIWRRFDDWSVLETFRPVSQTICTMLGEFHTQDNVLNTFWCPLTANKTRGFSFSARFNKRGMGAPKAKFEVFIPPPLFSTTSITGGGELKSSFLELTKNIMH